MSNIVLFRRSYEETKEARSEFNSLKISHRGKKCYCCNSLADAIHHIVMLKNGGDISGDNVTPVCESCHKAIHPWMRKIEEGRRFIASDGTFLIGPRIEQSIYMQRLTTLSWWRKIIRKKGSKEEIDQIEKAFLLKKGSDSNSPKAIKRREKAAKRKAAKKLKKNCSDLKTSTGIL